MTEPIHDEPWAVAAEQGLVLIDGEGLAFTMTVQAAEETARRLLNAAFEVRAASTSG